MEDGQRKIKNHQELLVSIQNVQFAVKGIRLTKIYGYLPGMSGVRLDFTSEEQKRIKSFDHILSKVARSIGLIIIKKNMHWKNWYKNMHCFDLNYRNQLISSTETGTWLCQDRRHFVFWNCPSNKLEIL